MKSLVCFLASLTFTWSLYANVTSSVRPQARPQCGDGAVLFDQSVVEAQLLELQNRISHQKQMNRMIIANQGIETDEATEQARMIEANRGTICDIDTIPNQVVHYAEGACGFDDVEQICTDNRGRAEARNQFVLSQSADNETGSATIRETYNTMVQQFNNTIEGNQTCSQAAQANIVENPICLNTLEAFAYRELAEDYISRCQESQIQAIYDYIGQGLERIGNNFQEKVIKPHCEARSFEHSIASFIINFEIQMANRNDPVELRAPASESGQE